MDKTQKEFLQRLQNALRAAYGYVKAHEREGTTRNLVLEIESLIPEVKATGGVRDENS